MQAGLDVSMCEVSKPPLAAVGAPENLIEVITGFAETREALVSSVDEIIFVGSSAVGKMIMRKAADTLITVTLERGKDPLIVCEDVDVTHLGDMGLVTRVQVWICCINTSPALLLRLLK